MKTQPPYKCSACGIEGDNSEYFSSENPDRSLCIPCGMEQNIVWIVKNSDGPWRGSKNTGMKTLELTVTQQNLILRALHAYQDHIITTDKSFPIVQALVRKLTKELACAGCAKAKRSNEGHCCAIHGTRNEEWWQDRIPGTILAKSDHSESCDLRDVNPAIGHPTKPCNCKVAR